MTKSDVNALDVFTFAPSKRTTSRYLGRSLASEEDIVHPRLVGLSEEASNSSVPSYPSCFSSPPSPQRQAEPQNPATTVFPTKIILEKVDSMSNLLQMIQNKQENLEKRIFAVEFKGCQMEQLMKTQGTENQAIYKDVVSSFVNALDGMQRAFVSDVKIQHEMLSQSLGMVVQELHNIRKIVEKKGPLDVAEALAHQFEESSLEDRSVSEYEIGDCEKRLRRTDNSSSFVTIYYDVGVYVPYSALRKQLRRHGVQSSLILNMYYRRGGIVEIVTYQSSSEVLVHDLSKLPTWTKVEGYDPVIGCLDSKKEDTKRNELQSRDVKNLICSYFTTVHAAILASNGSEALKNYYKKNAMDNTLMFIKSLPVSVSFDLEQLWIACSQN